MRCPFKQPRFPGEPSGGQGLEGKGASKGRGPLRGGAPTRGGALQGAGGRLVRGPCSVTIAKTVSSGWVLGLTPAPHSLEDGRPARTRSRPPPGGLLLVRPRPVPGAPVSPGEDVAPRLPSTAPGHPRPCGLCEPGGGGHRPDDLGVGLTPDSPAVRASPPKGGGWRAPQ